MTIAQVPHTTELAHRPVRACFVIDRLSRAGTEKQLLLTIAQFDQDEVVPYLCLLDGTDNLSKELLPDNCEVLRLGVTKLLSRFAFRQACRFWQYLRDHRIDVVQTFFLDSTRFAAPIAKAAGVRLVFGARRDTGYWFTKSDYFIARFYNRFFIDKIIVNSEAVSQSAILQEGIAPDRVLVIPNSIDLERFQHIPPWRPKPVNSPRKVGMVGNLREVKGPDLFIHAAQLVLQQYPDTQFEIAGSGDIAHYQQLIDELGLAGQVRLQGAVSDAPSFLATLDVAVLPSRAEGFSNALLEYMAAGRPIVATDVGGNRELITHGDNGLLVNADEHGLASGIRSLLTDSDFSQSLSCSAIQDVSKIGQKSIKRIQDVYAGAIRSLPQPTAESVTSPICIVRE